MADQHHHHRLLLLLLLLLLFLFLFLTVPASSAVKDNAPSFSFSFSSFDPTICRASLLFQGDTHLIDDYTGIISSSSPSSSSSSSSSSSPPSSSIQIGSSSPNSSGSLFFSHPAPMSASTSFSSSFSFSLVEHFQQSNRNTSVDDRTKSSLSFVVVSSPSLSPSSSDQVSILASVELDPLLADLYMSDAQSSAEALTGHVQEPNSHVQKPRDHVQGSTGQVQTYLEYHGLERLIKVRLSKPSPSPVPSPFKSAYHVGDLLSQHSSVYVGFMGRASEQKQYIIHTWRFNSWDSSQHSIPIDPNEDHHHHHTILTLENAYTRALTMVVSVVLFSSISAVALWALVERAFRRPRREVAMLPILCDYEKVPPLKEDKEGTIKG